MSSLSTLALEAPTNPDFDASAPAISVVLVTPDSYSTIARTMEHLAAQTVATQIELILVAPDASELGAPEGFDVPFGRVRIVTSGEGRTIAQCRALGARHASAEFVAFSEDHCFPEPNWAHELLEAHRDHVCVAPAFENGNPMTMLSWADYLLNFGTWGALRESGALSSLPYHNVSYHSSVLRRFDAVLEQMLGVEGLFTAQLRDEGHQLYLNARTRVHHLNVSLPRSFATAQFHSGRFYGATRCKSWSAPRRALYCLASPLIPLVRLREVRGNVERHRAQSRVLPRGLGWGLAAGLVLHTVGEVAGYLLGAGDAEKRKSEFESHRTRHMCQRDLAQLGLSRPARTV